MLWDLIVDPRVCVRFQTKGHLGQMSGQPGTVGFSYTLASARGRRVDTIQVVEAEPCRLLREQISSDVLAALAPGEVLHPSEQRTEFVPAGTGTMLHWQLRTPSPTWARPIVKLSARRTVTAILDGLAREVGE